MATAQPLPATAGAPQPGTQSGANSGTQPGTGAQRAAGKDAVQALVPAPQPPPSAEETVFPAPIPQLPVALAVSVPVRDFRVRELLTLVPGDVIATQWSHGDDLPIAAGDVQLAWSEFEVVETKLAVRITRLS